MKIVITDTGMSPVRLTEEDLLIGNSGEAKACTGCFSCWVKTPGTCVIDDRLKDMGFALSGCDELIIVSSCRYGSYSPFVKNVMERCLSYVRPDFEIRGGKMRHKRRYGNVISVSAWFYGEDLYEEEKECARQLIQRNAENLGGKVKNIVFVGSASGTGAIV